LCILLHIVSCTDVILGGLAWFC